MKIRLVICLSMLLPPFFMTAQYDAKGLEKEESTIQAFKAKNEKFDAYFNNAYGYIVFPTVGKGASGIGGAFGRGTVYEKGKPIGKAKITQITIGFQFGGQSYSEVIFFESKADLARFKENKFEFAAQASAVAIEKGAAANFAYDDGVAVFTITKGGLMYEESIGGQKLKFKPYKKKRLNQL